MATGLPRNGTTWVVRDKFEGLVTYIDPEKVKPGSATAGYNVSFNYGDIISNRQLGYQPYPSNTSASMATDPIISQHTFRKRDGSNLMMRSQTTIMEYFDETSKAWVTIKGGFTASQRFGYTDFNINTDQHSYVYFCNAVEDMYKWTGNITNLTQALHNGDSTVHVTDTTGFSASGNLTISGTSTPYSAIGSSTTFTLTSPWGGATIANGTGITETPADVSGAPKGNILTNYSNRIFIAGIIATPQAVYFSTYGDADTYTNAALVTSSTATDPGIFNLAEGGGGVVGFTRDEQALYIVKPNIVYVVTLSDSFYSLEPLKPFDGKSQTTGGIATRCIFANGNGSVIITPDNRILNLTRIQTIDYPQLIPISDDIFPTVDALDFTNAAGITFQQKMYIACSTEKGGQNDTVLVYNTQVKLWETPVTGWNVQDWQIYNNGVDGDRLFFGSNNSTNTYEVTTTPMDGDFDVSSNVIMNQETFGDPAEQKFIDNFYVEGYITENTDPLTISLFFNDKGYTQILTATIAGTNTDLLFSTNNANVFGFNPFGLEVFGSDSGGAGKKKFRLYTKNTLRNIPFYNISVGFSSDGANQDWSVLVYAFKAGIYQNVENRKLYIGFNTK